MDGDPIAFSYEADHHCPECTELRFGRNERGCIAEGAEDDERNEVGALFSEDEWWNPETEGPQTLVCGTCGVTIATLNGDEYEVQRLSEAPAPCRACLPGSRVTQHTCGLRGLQNMLKIRI